MKGPVLAASTLVPAILLASACASAPRVPAMPDWSAPEAAPVVASAPRDIDDDDMRVPRDVEPEKHWQSSGLYVGGAIVSAQPMGDFDGDDALFGPTDVVIIPDIDVGAGAGAYVSYRWHMNELVIQYSITEHDGDFSGSPREHDTTFEDVDFYWRHYFWEHSALQPYGVFGLGYSRAEIDDGSTDQATGTIFQDAELTDGITVSLGAGAALYTLPWVMFFGQATYKFVRYETSDGIDGEFSNTPDIDGDGWNLQVGAAFRLLPPRH